MHLLKTVRPDYQFYVLRNGDKQVLSQQPDALVVGPGPMTPADTGVLQDYFEQVITSKHIPVLGVCLGMQFIAWHEGVEVDRSTSPAHGAETIVKHQQNNIFKGASPHFKGARYNSLEIQSDRVENSPELELLAYAPENNAAMALKHINHPWVGVQFHPESFLTTRGDIIVDNFFVQYVEV